MQDVCWPFHLFGANFATESEARKFVIEQWEPEPPESISEAEYVSWEDRNPIWKLAEELGFYMDSDFVELAGTPDDVIAQMRSQSERALVGSKVLPQAVLPSIKAKSIGLMPVRLRAEGGSKIHLRQSSTGCRDCREGCDLRLNTVALVPT